MSISFVDIFNYFSTLILNSSIKLHLSIHYENFLQTLTGAPDIKYTTGTFKFGFHLPLVFPTYFFRLYPLFYHISLCFTLPFSHYTINFVIFHSMSLLTSQYITFLFCHLTSVFSASFLALYY